MINDLDFYLEKIDYKGIVALIPARGGSKGVPKKNIRPLNGHPLIAYSIAAALQSRFIKRTIVTTDSREIADISERYGAEVPFIRPEEYASDHSGDMEYVEHFIKFAAENEGAIPEYIVQLRPTTPLRDVAIMDMGIECCINDKECCSLRSAHKCSESPYKWFLRDEHGYFKSVSPELSNDEANGGRQHFPDVYIPDGYVDVLKSSYIIHNNKLHGRNMKAFESPFCSEIDTMDDFAYLEYDIQKNESSLLSYLGK